MTVLSDAETADTASELIEFYDPDVTVDGDSLSIPVGTDYRLSFVPIGATLSRDRDGKLDWNTVRRLKIMELSDAKSRAA